MKKLSQLLLAIVFILLTISQLSAQRKLIFKGEKFDVMFKVKASDKEITDVFFATDEKWYRFSIESYETYEDKTEGFVLRVVDGNERYFWIDYYKKEDYIIVTDEEDNSTWKLHHQKSS
jgi:hypothetical protein